MIRTIPALQDLGGNVNLSQLGMQTEGEDDSKKNQIQLSVANKLKIYMKTIRTDETIVKGIAKEFEALVKQIIFI